jgi:hypothetical protein
LADGFFTTDLLSEIYYRNKAGRAYADIDANKVAPEPSMYSFNNKVIEGTRIKNVYILNKLRE